MPPTGPVSIDSPAPLDPDTLVFRTMDGGESLSQCFEYRVTVSSPTELNASDLLGVATTVHLETTDGGLRHFNGVIAALDFLGSDEVVNYRLVLRPWLWLLTRSANCRIFQSQSVVDIISSVFRALNFTDFDTSLIVQKYPPREYVVQYRESDFDFVSRLMEGEGIYYYFRHDDAKHTLVLTDSWTGHDFPPSASGGTGFALPYRPADVNRIALEEFVENWRVRNTVQTGVYSHADFDFTKSRAKLFATRVNQPGNAYDGLEVYDYPGGFDNGGDGDAGALVRLQGEQVPCQDAKAWSNGRKLAVGSLFSLTDYPRADQNQDYLVTSAAYRLRGHAAESGDAGGSGGEVFDCVFTAMLATTQFRPPYATRRPFVRGPQTARVVGPAGNEIWTDNYGRVKVQFHWDREGNYDEKSSCFVRVSQAWAGTQFGSIHIPRIGQEVIVDFLEGDPDRPIITGRVYNDANMPPYDLPAHQTQSGVKSRSTKGGGKSNANEIRFEDMKGSEEVFVQAEKDLNSVVKNNETRSVGSNRSTSIGHDESLSVGNDRSAKVGANETITVGNNESISIGANEKVAIGANLTMDVGANESVTIGADQSLVVGGSRSETVGATETILVAAAQIVTAGSQAVTVGSRVTTVAADDALTVGGSRTETFGGDLALSVGGGRSESVSGDESVSVSGEQAVTIGKTGTISVTKQFVINSDEEIVIQSGDASITLKKNGDIVFKGNNISSDASGKVTVKASSDLVLKGSKISQN